MANHSARYQLVLVAACAMLLAVSLMQPNYPQEQWLQHPPTVLALVTLALAAKKGWLSDGAAMCLVAFLALYVVGARWIYSYVPYERWCDAVFGSGPYEWFGWRRNHYDRVVHVAFGALMVAPLSEVSRRYGRTQPAWAIGFALLTIMAVGALYEVFEWLLAMIAAPDYAVAYNGQQGDMWDAQKDMALGMLGALTVAAWKYRQSRLGAGTQ
jgi:putative membrane protein